MLSPPGESGAASSDSCGGDESSWDHNGMDPRNRTSAAAATIHHFMTVLHWFAREHANETTGRGGESGVAPRSAYPCRGSGVRRNAARSSPRRHSRRNGGILPRGSDEAPGGRTRQPFAALPAERVPPRGLHGVPRRSSRTMRASAPSISDSGAVGGLPVSRSGRAPRIQPRLTSIARVYKSSLDLGLGGCWGGSPHPHRPRLRSPRFALRATEVEGDGAVGSEPELRDGCLVGCGNAGLNTLVWGGAETVASRSAVGD